MPRDLTTFFYPKSIAIVGVSRSPEKLGSIVLRNIIKSGFKGNVYPINPKIENINELKCYKSLADISEIVELAVIAVPADTVLQVLNQAGDKDIKNVIVLASGFKETGVDGEKLESELIQAANKYGINLLGPNCLGFINTSCPLNATFGELIKEKGISLLCIVIPSFLILNGNISIK